MSINKNGIVYTVIFSFITTILLVAPLAVANELTKDLVKQNATLAEAKAVMSALDVPVSSVASEVLAAYDSLQTYTVNDKGELTAIAREQVNAAKASGFPISPLYYVAQLGAEKRIAGNFAGPGLWGTITLSLGFKTDLSAITGIAVVAQVETPGLGARIADPWFIAQFRGQQIPSSSVIRFNLNGDGDTNMQDDVVDGVTGATLTTNGVRDIVNKAIVVMKKLLAGGSL